MWGFKDRVPIKGVLSFRLIGADGKQKPLFKENAIGRAHRKLSDWLHSGEPIDPELGPDWHRWCQKRRSCGIWTLDPVQHSNLLVTAGKAVMASRLNGSGGEAAVTYLEIGTNNTSPVVGDTLLNTPITTDDMARGSATVSIQTSTTARLVFTFGPNSGASKSVVEAGDFNNAANNTVDMLARSVFGTKTVDASESLQVTYDHEIT